MVIVLYERYLTGPSQEMPMRRVKDQDDPKRCRGTAADRGQCWNESVGDSDFCPVHGGRERDIDAMKDYLTEQFERRIKLDIDSNDEVKLLKENLMRLNAMLAASANKVKDDASLEANAGTIIDLTMKAEKVTASLKRLEQASGLLLAKPALITWGQQIVHAVAAKIEDKYDGWEDDLMELSHDVAQIITVIQNAEDEK